MTNLSNIVTQQPLNYYLSVLYCSTPYALRTPLILLGIGSTRCWRHSLKSLLTCFSSVCTFVSQWYRSLTKYCPASLWMSLIKSLKNFSNMYERTRSHKVTDSCGSVLKLKTNTNTCSKCCVTCACHY